jgi:hypothetical protein
MQKSYSFLFQVLVGVRHLVMHFFVCGRQTDMVGQMLILIHCVWYLVSAVEDSLLIFLIQEQKSFFSPCSKILQIFVSNILQ